MTHSSIRTSFLNPERKVFESGDLYTILVNCWVSDQLKSSWWTKWQYDFFPCLITRCKNISLSHQVIININWDKTIISCRQKPPPHSALPQLGWWNEPGRAWHPGFLDNRSHRATVQRQAPTKHRGRLMGDQAPVSKMAMCFDDIVWTIPKFKWKCGWVHVLNLTSVLPTVVLSWNSPFFLSPKMRRTATTVKLLPCEI